MSFEAAREGEYPKMFDELEVARAYVGSVPAIEGDVRPWIRDASRPSIMGSFLMIGGKEQALWDGSKPGAVAA